MNSASAVTTVAADATDLGMLDDLVGYHLRRAMAVVGNDFTRALGDTGIRQALFAILSVVGANPGIHQSAVGRALGIQRANMVSLINELVDRGLLDRKTSEEDRRAFQLGLSAAGDAVLDDCRERIRRHEDILLGDLTKAERATLIALLVRIEVKES